MVNVGRYRFDKVAELFQFVAAVFLALVVLLYFWRMSDDDAGPDAVILTDAGAVTAQWSYQQLPMRECRWCGRTVNLNRHHVVPQAANPALRDVRENLIVLCRDCHFVLGHRCDWKRYNPDVMYIASHFTNVVLSADTRYAVTNVTPAESAPATGREWRNAVTNNESLNEAIGRLFNGNQGNDPN